jgi:hypothetical protein
VVDKQLQCMIVEKLQINSTAVIAIKGALLFLLGYSSDVKLI